MVIQDSQVNQELERNVAHAFQFDGISIQGMVIVARSGRVFLYGYASSQDERSRIEAVTRAVPGVSSVENHVCVNLFA